MISPFPLGALSSPVAKNMFPVLQISDSIKKNSKIL
jgi:hypothetical protein